MVTISTLSRTPNLVLGAAFCGAATEGPAEEELQTSHAILFPMSGTYARQVDGIRTVANSAMALFASPGEVQQVSHPAGGHDTSLFITLSVKMVEPFLRGSSDTFPYRSVVSDPSVDLAIRLLARRAKIRQVTALELEETIIGIATHLTSSWEKPDVSSSAHRRSVIGDAIEYMSVHFQDDVGLPTIAKAIGTSPHHLSRVFRAVNGVTISQYRTRLRLHFAVDRLMAGATDISRIAVEAGFYDHAHLTNSMKRYMKMTPSMVRAIGSTAEEAESTAERG